MEFVDLKKQYALIKEDMDWRIHNVLEHMRFINGPEIVEMEQELAEFCGAKYCIGVSSGTDALIIAMMALGIKPGDEIITTSFTFIATAETMALLGAKCVFVDIDPKTYNMDADKLEAAITDKTKLIIPVSLYGQCSDMEAINAIAAKYNLPVLEDGAQSFGATQRGKKSCNLSTLASTSFFPAKPLGCYGDGGACFTSDDNLAEAMREIRNHGQSKRYLHTRIGMNGRIDTMQAAVLQAKMAIFPKEVELRQQIADAYNKLLGEHVITPYIEEFNTSVYAQYTIRVKNRDELREKCKQAGIPTAVHYPIPINKQPVFTELYGEISVPNAEDAAEHVMSLPMHPYLEQQDIETIAKIIIENVEK